VAFEHLKRPDLTSLDGYAAMVRPFLSEAGILDPADSILHKAIGTIRQRARTLREAATAMAFYFMPPEFDEKAQAKFLTPATAPVLAQLTDVLRAVETWTAVSLESAVGAWLASKNLAIKDVAQPARVALTGRSASPGLFEVFDVLGKSESISRIEHAVSLIGSLPTTPPT
jgi:glutamyl-tRNA synthetase